MIHLRWLVSVLAAAALAMEASGPGGLVASREEIPLPEGRWTAPAPSPDGRFLAFTSEGYRGLKLLEMDTGKVVTLSESRGAGFHASWSEDSRSIAFRTSTGGTSSRVRIVVAHPDGVAETASPLESSLSVPLWRGAQLIYAKFGEDLPSVHRVGPAGTMDRFVPPVASPDGRLWLPARRGEGFDAVRAAEKIFFLPALSADGTRFAVECLDGHLYLGSTPGRELEDLGPGSYPSFVRQDEVLLFERTVDDGHHLLGADIFMMDLKTREIRPVTATPDALERRPRMAGDGHTLFYESGGRIFRGWVP